MRRVLFVLPLIACACQFGALARVPGDHRPGGLFVTRGDIQEPYDSLGIVQVQRSGVQFAGAWDPAETDLDTTVRTALLPQIQAMGGDGIVHVQFHQTMLTPTQHITLAILFCVPVPTETVIRGEVVKLRRGR